MEEQMWTHIGNVEEDLDDLRTGSLGSIKGYGSLGHPLSRQFGPSQGVFSQLESPRCWKSA